MKSKIYFLSKSTPGLPAVDSLGFVLWPLLGICRTGSLSRREVLLSLGCALPGRVLQAPPMAQGLAEGHALPKCLQNVPRFSFLGCGSLAQRGCEPSCWPPIPAHLG